MGHDPRYDSRQRGWTPLLLLRSKEESDRARALPICSQTRRINRKVRRFTEFHVVSTCVSPLRSVKQTSFPEKSDSQVSIPLRQRICVCQEESEKIMTSRERNGLAHLLLGLPKSEPQKTLQGGMVLRCCFLTVFSHRNGANCRERKWSKSANSHRFHRNSLMLQYDCQISEAMPLSSS